MYEHFFSNYMLELHKMISNGFDTNTFKVAQDQSLWKHTNKELTWFHSYSLSYTRNFTNSVKQFAKLPKRCKTKLGLKSFRLNFLIFGSRDHLVHIGHFCQSRDKTGTSLASSYAAFLDTPRFEQPINQIARKCSARFIQYNSNFQWDYKIGKRFIILYINSDKTVQLVILVILEKVLP